MHPKNVVAEISVALMQHVFIDILTAKEYAIVSDT